MLAGTLLSTVLVNGGSIPDVPLTSEEFNTDLLLSGTQEAYIGPFWTEWSDPYGCGLFKVNPFGASLAEGDAHFCRVRRRDYTPDSVQWKFCTLPDVKVGSPFVYGNPNYTINGYYSPDNSEKSAIYSKHSKAHPFFAGYESPTNDWSSVSAPAGDAASLKGWVDQPVLYQNAERKHVYDDFTWKHSHRVACDARIAHAAKVCYQEAFSEKGGIYSGGMAPFCDTWNLEAIKDKCSQMPDNKCGNQVIGQVNSRGDFENEIRIALTLLIEDKIEVKGVENVLGHVYLSHNL